jgi:DNA sulfur modification protein DndC
LKDLLTVQKEIQNARPYVTLINNQELIAIQVIWNRDLYFDHTVGELYKSIYQKDINTTNIQTFNDTEKRIVREVCETNPEYFDLISNLIDLQQTKTLMITKYGLHNDLEKRIEQFAEKL